MLWLALLASTTTAADNGLQQPVLPTNAIWVAPMLGFIILIFLSAAVLGPIYRALAPETRSEANAHDPTADHGHRHT